MYLTITSHISHISHMRVSYINKHKSYIHMKKIGLSKTLGRIKSLRKILKNNKPGLYHNEIYKLMNINPVSLSNLIYNFFNGKVSISKIGRNKLFKIIDTTPSNKEKALISREKALKKAKNLRECGYSYSEINRILMKEFHTGLGIRNLQIFKIKKRGLIRYNKKFKEDRKKAGKIGGNISVTTGHIYKIQPLGIEARLKKVMLRIPESSKVLSSSKIRILSHCLFDGFISDRGSVIGYCNSSKILINQFIKDIKEVYGLEHYNIIIRESGYVIRYFSKAVLIDLKRYLYIKEDIEKLNDEIMKISSEWKIEFLRSFWDDEGMVKFNTLKDKKGYSHTHRFIEAYQKNIEILNQIKIMHESLGIEARINKNKIKVSTKENLKKFYKIIGFSPGVVSCRKSSK